MRWIPASNETLYENYCEMLQDDIERICSLDMTPSDRKQLRHKEFLLDQFTWMVAADMGYRGAPASFLGDMFDEA